MSPTPPRVHDHYGGSARCIECGGACRLEGAERVLTDVIRFYFEGEAITRRAGMAMSLSMQLALERAGVDIDRHRRRAAESI